MAGSFGKRRVDRRRVGRRIICRREKKVSKEYRKKAERKGEEQRKNGS